MKTVTDLEVEIAAVEQAMECAFFRVEHEELNKRRAELLGELKERKRDELWDDLRA